MIEASDTLAGRVFDGVIQGFIVVSLVSFSIDTLPDLAPQTRAWLRGIEWVTIMIFTAEYLMRLVVADNRWRFATSFFGLIDLVAILPFYVSTGVDLRGVRAVRLLRVARTLKLLRYSRAIRRFHRAFLIAKEEMVLFACTAAVVLYLSAVGIYYFENAAQPEHFASVFHSLWWAVATLTTVGYGDVYPVTVGGKLFTFVVLMVGLGIVSVPAGLVASALGRAREEEAAEAKRGGNPRNSDPEAP